VLLHEGVGAQEPRLFAVGEAKDHRALRALLAQENPRDLQERGHGGAVVGCPGGRFARVVVGEEEDRVALGLGPLDPREDVAHLPGDWVGDLVAQEPFEHRRGASGGEDVLGGVGPEGFGRGIAKERQPAQHGGQEDRAEERRPGGLGGGGGFAGEGHVSGRR
jgi:hypothetical protein